MTIRSLLARMMAIAMLTACSAPQSDIAAQPPAPAQPSLPPQPPASPVTAWLDCVECSDAELKPLVSLGDKAVPELRTVLLNGPSKERLDNHQQHLQNSYRSLKGYEQRRKDRAVPLSEQEYVQLYLPKYIMLNRTRAARALGAIGTTQAGVALREALNTKLPTELQREVERVLKSIA